METIILKVEGYWRDINRKSLPAYSGIYFVYEARYEPETQIANLINVLYVGSALNIKERIETHNLKENWQQYLKKGEELCYSAAYVKSANMARVKAAFVHDLRPVLNIESNKDIKLEPITIYSTGKTKFLKTIFSV